MCNVKCDLPSTAVGILILLFRYVKLYNLKFFKVALVGSKVFSRETGPPCPAFIIIVSYSKSSKPVSESCFCGRCFSLLIPICVCMKGGTEVIPAIFSCRNYTYSYNKMYICHAYILYKV